MEKCQSFEEKYFGREKPFGKFLREVGKTGYGVVAGMFRVPNIVRKGCNGQTRIQRKEYKGEFSKIVGTATGYVAGACANIYFIQHAVHELSRKNYIPAAALGLTNFASLWYEIGRKEKSRSEKIHNLTEMVNKEKTL